MTEECEVIVEASIISFLVLTSALSKITKGTFNLLLIVFSDLPDRIG
jgi:hypothetical protein